jgi:hypothetical protein
MAKVTNKFYIKAIHDGSSVYAEMMSTQLQLTQRLRPDGSCIPNWNQGESGAVNPILYPRVKVGSSYRSPLIDVSKNEGFYYNGSLITWTTVNSKKVSSNCTVVVGGTTYYLFELLESYSHDGITGPAIKIIHNLAGGTNPDNDIIRFDGHVEESGTPIDFSVGQAIRITVQGASGFSFAYGGRSYVNEEEAANAIYVQLYEDNAKEPSLASAYITKWFYEGGSEITTASKKGVNTGDSSITVHNVEIPSQSHYLKVNRDDIDDYAVFRCEIYKTHNPPAAGDAPDITAFIEVDDKSDKFEMFIVCDTSGAYGQKDISIRSGQVVTMKAWMGDNNVMASEYADGAGNHPFNSFKCRLTDDETNSTISSSASNPIIPPAGKSLDANGYFDITTQNMTINSVKKPDSSSLTVTNGGAINIGFDFVEANGGGVTGYILAEATTTV